MVGKNTENAVELEGWRNYAPAWWEMVWIEHKPQKKTYELTAYMDLAESPWTAVGESGTIDPRVRLDWEIAEDIRDDVEEIIKLMMVQETNDLDSGEIPGVRDIKRRG